jgi:hypothetical protein
MEEPLIDASVERSIALPAPFPGIMLAAAILWILAGAAYMGLFALSRVLQLPFEATELWLLAGAAFFISDGVQLLRGRFRDPLSDGVITILIGLFFLGSGFLNAGPDGDIIHVVVAIFFGLVFLVPGILVLVGRKSYLAWKAEQGL